MKKSDWTTAYAGSLTVVLLGCGTSGLDVVKTRAANEFSCPVDSVVVQELAANAYRADACGTTATYSCLGGNFGNPFPATCQREGNPTTSPSASDGLPDKPLPDVVGSALSAALPNARRCVSAGDATSKANVAFASSGKVYGVVVTGGASGKASEDCIKKALATVSIPPFKRQAYAADVVVRSN